LTLETLVLEAGERGEVVLYPEHDVLGPRITVEGTDDFVVEDVLLGNLPALTVGASGGRERTWSAKIPDVLACPERPLKVLVRNPGAGKITLRATIAEENA
jgi:hypothetical protein